MTTEKTKEIERPPVIVIMGHIDHGKSTLLDYIRESNTVDKEAGGITQHIAAYEVSRGDKRITFLDTPGHEAFQATRQRGSDVADIAILIVSAEDGVMPQTKEALECIKESGIPYVVAINKMDSNKADVEKTKNSLLENEVYLEGLGGQISYVPISAKTGEGVDDLLDTILLTAEIEEFTGDPAIPAEGIMVEANKDKQRGITGTIIVKNGTLKKGDFVACQNALSPVRAILDHNGDQLESASFSTPVSISGWTDLPEIGAEIRTFSSKKEAETFCKNCTKENTEVKIGGSTSNIFSIPLIIKTDVSGTYDAIVHEIKKIKVDGVSFKVVDSSTGNIGEADMKIAAGTPGTIVLGFGVKIDSQAEALRERDGIETKVFSVIYELAEYLEKVAKDRKPVVKVEQVTGRAKILRTFSSKKNHHVIGGKIKEGTLQKGEKVNILRRDEKIDEGVIKELQTQKIKTEEVREGDEFGMMIESKFDIAEGDYIEGFTMVEK